MGVGVLVLRTVREHDLNRIVIPYASMERCLELGNTLRFKDLVVDIEGQDQIPSPNVLDILLGAVRHQHLGTSNEAFNKIRRARFWDQ
jgi:hypothetical protein